VLLAAVALAAVPAAAGAAPAAVPESATAPAAAPETGTAPAAAAPAVAAASTLIILDSSGSMASDAGDGRSRLAVAQDSLDDVLSTLPGGQAVGLRVFGHRAGRDDRIAGCDDTELLVPVEPLDAGRISAAVAGLTPTGLTPIGRSLEAGAADLPATGDRSIILVSDGVDECGPPEPCDVARGLAAGGLAVRVNTVGFQVDDEGAAILACIAEVTGGAFTDIDDPDGLANAFRSYLPQGTPVEGGPRAELALPLGPGLYTDTIASGEERWYAVAVGDRQALSTAVTVPGEPEGQGRPVRSGELALGLRRDDVLGELQCAQDGEDAIGAVTAHVALSTSTADDDAGLCAEPGTRLIRVALGGPNSGLGPGLSGPGVPGLQLGRPDPARRYRFELLVDLAEAPAQGAAARPDPPGPAAGEGPLGGPRPAPPISLPAVVAAAVAGAAAGVLLMRARLGDR